MIMAFKKSRGRRLWELYTPFQNVLKIAFMCEKKYYQYICPEE